MKRKIILDSDKRRVESGIQAYVPISGTKRRKIETILETTRKTKNINIRISQQDLESLRRSAEQEGIPYQTLINLYLRECAASQKHLHLAWLSAPKAASRPKVQGKPNRAPDSIK